MRAFPNSFATEARPLNLARTSRINSTFALRRTVSDNAALAVGISFASHSWSQLAICSINLIAGCFGVNAQSSAMLT
jgi:hypothetical protein